MKNENTGLHDGNTAEIDSASIRVSLDVENVLVDTFSYFIPTYNEEYGTDYEVTDIDSWEWARQEVDWNDFDGLIHEGWLNPIENMEPKENNVSKVVNELASHDSCWLDIVTARTGVEEEMKKWLSYHGITEYNRFRATEISKSEFDYNIFIDDKPGLAENLSETQLQYLIIGPHNNRVIEHDDVIAVDTISDAVEHMNKHVLVGESIDEYW